MENLAEVIPSKFEKISSPNATFVVVSQALPERHKDFWKLFKNEWENENRKALSDFIDSNTTVIDLGAWVGPFTLFSAALGAKHVYAFEPDNYAREFLQENYLANPVLQNKITIFKDAIAKVDGEIKIGPLSGRSLGESTTSTEGTNLMSVPSISIETLRSRCNLDMAVKTCIKIDIEGAEKYILSDIEKMLSKINKPFLLVVEIHPFHFNKEDSKIIESAIAKLISMSDEFNFKQRRRIGESRQYPNEETAWRSELHHPNGLFDMTFKKNK